MELAAVMWPIAGLVGLAFLLTRERMWGDCWVLPLLIFLAMVAGPLTWVAAVPLSDER